MKRTKQKRLAISRLTLRHLGTILGGARPHVIDPLPTTDACASIGCDSVNMQCQSVDICQGDSIKVCQA
jgi:hypothetical protein